MNHVSKIFILIVVAGMFTVFVAGCEKHTRYKVLTFFFTGVPIDGETTDGSKTVVAKVKRKRPVPQIFLHGPKAAGECFHCHDTTSTQSFRNVKKGGMPSFSDIKPGRLVMPLKELCITCHTSKSADLRYFENLWVHGPIAEGYCTSCHDYHQTKYRYMLLRENTRDLCTQCHAEGFILQTEEHKSDEECISCHNPHLGANRLLLRKDFDEVF